MPYPSLPETVLELRATAKAEAMLALAPRAGVSFDDLEHALRRLVGHEREYDRASEASKRRELVRLMDDEIAIFGYGVQEARSGRRRDGYDVPSDNLRPWGRARSTQRDAFALSPWPPIIVKGRGDGSGEKNHQGSPRVGAPGRNVSRHL